MKSLSYRFLLTPTAIFTGRKFFSLCSLTIIMPHSRSINSIEHHQSGSFSGFWSPIQSSSGNSYITSCYRCLGDTLFCLSPSHAASRSRPSPSLDGLWPKNPSRILLESTFIAARYHFPRLRHNSPYQISAYTRYRQGSQDFLIYALSLHVFIHHLTPPGYIHTP